MLRKPLSWLLLFLFLAGIASWCPLCLSPAEGKARKKTMSKTKRKAAKAVKSVKKKSGKIKKAAKKTSTKKALTKKKTAKPGDKPAVIKAAADSYSLPAGAGMVSQKYALQNKIYDSDQLIGEMRALGVADASVDLDSNTLSVKFNSADLSSIGIIKKLKALGYSVKNIN
jgi:hypothetical protein